MKTKDLMLGAMLTAFSLIIPLAFGGFLRIYLPPFSATLASHLPLFLGITISPLVGAMVGVGSAIGFFTILGPVVGARAAIHIILGFVGGSIYRKNKSITKTLTYILPIHAIGEALIVIPFGFDPYTAIVIVGLGTGLHHILDSIITAIVFKNVQYFTKKSDIAA